MFKWQRVLATMTILALAVSCVAPLSHADLAVQLRGNSFMVTWNIDASQNITDYVKTQVFPANLSIVLANNELSAFTASIQRAVQGKVPTAEVSDAVVKVISNSANVSCSFNCRPQWLNVTAQFTVDEHPQVNAGIATYPMSWKAAAVTDELTANGTGFNRIGDDYLTSAVFAFVDTTHLVPGHTLRYVLNGFPYLKDAYQSATNNVVLFDASVLQTPLDQWGFTWDISTQTQKWTSPQSLGFSAAGLENIQEGDVSATIAYIASSHFSASVSAPMNALARGDNLNVDQTNGFWNLIMLIIVVASPVALAVTIIIDRRLTRRTTKAYRGRKK